MIPLEELHCLIDDFCKEFERSQNYYLLPNLNRKRQRKYDLSIS